MSQLNFNTLLKGDFHPETDADWEFLKSAAQNLFKPKAPIDDDKLFSGRFRQIRDVLDVVCEDGAHAVIFGERGVGKTSLANIIEKKVIPIMSAVKCIKISCSPDESFFDLWAHVLYDYSYEGKSIADVLKKFPTAHVVYKILETIDNTKHHLIIFDEFDRIKKPKTTVMMADLIKHFSNNPANLTILIVGVGGTLLDLFSGHESIVRCCSQIKMQRMSPIELVDIVDERLPKLKMSMDLSVKEQIVKLAQGLPGYAHLLGQLCVRAALDSKELAINPEHLATALKEALDKADYSTRQDYYKAVDSPAKDNKYKEVLLACALAETNELGLFFAGDVREPYSALRRRKMEIANYATHLNEFCHSDRGSALIKSGKRKRYQYRFANPLLQPLVVMAGVKDGLIKIDDVKTSSSK